MVFRHPDNPTGPSVGYHIVTREGDRDEIAIHFFEDGHEDASLSAASRCANRHSDSERSAMVRRWREGSTDIDVVYNGTPVVHDTRPTSQATGAMPSEILLQKRNGVYRQECV